jgi:hypothetical protein
LPELAGAVNSLFNQKREKKVLSIHQLFKKNNYESVDKKSDLDRLIEESNKWLIVQNNLVRRNPSLDINYICMLLM